MDFFDNLRYNIIKFIKCRRNDMKIIVAGCGKIGLAVLSSLVSEEHDVTVIDNDLSVVSSATDIYDAIGVCGNCVDCEILTEAGAEKTDLFIATTGSDELNMLSCFLAKKMGAKHTVAKISNPDYNDSRLGFVQKQLDISLTVNPELLADALRQLCPELAPDFAKFKRLEIFDENMSVFR